MVHRHRGEPDVAVVDVETTGGRSWHGHRIVEIAIVEVLGGEIVAEYDTLVNPAQGIPSMITSLTGITSEMTSAAPYFEHIADEIADRLKGRAFVAHNATFDWGLCQPSSSVLVWTCRPCRASAPCGW